jgi:CheY-like chemotaxis protein
LLNPAGEVEKVVEISRIPIIALTALAMPGDRERTLDAGADEYLSKSARLKELDSQIKTFLEKVEAESAKE